MERFIPDLVSVIIPTYNSEQYIKRTIESALAQTYKDIEVIVVDDCSKDNTRDVIKKIAEQDHRVKLIFQKTNQGAAITRNIGIKHANGEYVAFLDSDDLWVPEKIEKQVILLKSGKRFVFCAYDFIDGKGKAIGGKTRIETEVTYKDELTKTYISTPTVVYDRKFFNDPDFPLRRTGQDYAFWLVLLRKANAYGIDEALVHVTRRKGSLSPLMRMNSGK